MKIHYYSQFFAAPDSPGSHRPRRLVKQLADNGHQVEVIACNHIDDINMDEELYESPNNNNGWYRVHRLKAARNMRASLTARMRTYFGFAVRALKLGLRLAKPDVVVASIQPMFTGWSGKLVSLWHRIPFLLEVRDLWPDALEVKGAVTGWKVSVLHWLVNGLYKSADRLISLTPGIKNELVKKGIAANMIDVLPNGFDPELFELKEATREKTRADYDWNDSFVVLYTGTHTEVTAIDVIVKAAEHLKNKPNIRFDLFGRGQTKPKAIEMAKRLGLNNVYFHDSVPKTEVPALIAAADLVVMTLFKSPLIDIYFQNKFIDYMGAGKPIVAAMAGQQAEIIKRWKTGRVVNTFDAKGLSRLVLEAQKQPEIYAEMGQNGKHLVEQNLLLPNIIDHYCRIIEAAANTNGEKLPIWEPDLKLNNAKT